MVPSDGEDATLMAVDVKLGNWVMCSDQVAKKVIGKREYVAAGLLRCSAWFSLDLLLQRFQFKSFS